MTNASPAPQNLARTRTGRPKFKNTDDVVSYWVERLLTRQPAAEWASLNSMGYRNDDLTHYGHFTIATALRRPSGSVRMVLLNGDRWSGSGGYGPSTGSRQMEAETAVKATGLPYLTVPFSALGAAQIEMASIDVLEMLRETWTVAYTRETQAQIEDRLTFDIDGDSINGFTVRDMRHSYRENVRLAIDQDADGMYLYPHFRHWLGEAIFTAKLASESGRRRKFLSAFDHNEPGQSYFLCELPRTGARTVAAALEALKPPAVKRAMEASLAVIRQGDIFAIPTSLTTRELKRRALGQTIERYEPVQAPPSGHGTIWARVPYNVKSLRMAPLLTTNHVATEQLLTLDGDTYARGFLRHRPDGREPDHTPVRLGDGQTWYRILRNTVPLARARSANSSLFGPQQSGQSRAWTLGGQVD
jgi:hypothetical protein